MTTIARKYHFHFMKVIPHTHTAAKNISFSMAKQTQRQQHKIAAEKKINYKSNLSKHTQRCGDIDIESGQRKFA